MSKFPGTAAKTRFSVNRLVVLALLTACEIILSRFLSVAVWNFKIGFAFIPVVIAGWLFGPLGGALVGGLSDLLGALLFPIGAYFPGFTLTAALVGLCYGLLLRQRHEFLRVFLCVALTQIFGSLLLDTVWISLLYGSPFLGLLPLRALQSAGMLTVKLLVIPAMLTALSRIPFILRLAAPLHRAEEETQS